MRAWLLVAVGTVVAALLLAVPVVAVSSHLGEPTVPDPEALPAVPDGATIVERREGCGSGSCYRELLLRPAPGESAVRLVERLDVSDACGAGSVFDRRRHCTSARVEPDGVQVRVSVSIG